MIGRITATISTSSNQPRKATATSAAGKKAPMIRMNGITATATPGIEAGEVAKGTAGNVPRKVEGGIESA